MIKLVILLTVIISGFSSSLFGNENISKRQEAMQVVRSSMKILGPMAMGQTEFENSKAKDTLSDFLNAIKPYKDYFPEEPTAGQKTDASLEIWLHKEDFNKKIDSFVSTVKIASTNKWKDTAAFKADFMEIGNSCKSCHRKYRR